MTQESYRTWKELYGNLVITKTRGKKRKKTTSKVLADFEASIGFKFPVSYREYIDVFGAGELGGYFRIYSPKVEQESGQFLNLLDLIEIIRESKDVYIEKFGQEDLFDQIIPFSDTIGGDVIGWNSSDQTNRDTSEYGIYMYPDDQNQVIKLSDTFEAFIYDVCLSDEFGKIIGDQKYKASNQFTPFT